MNNPAQHDPESEGTPEDDDFTERAVVVYSVMILGVVMAPAALLMGLDSLWMGSDGCSGGGPNCSDRASQAVLVGWAVLFVGFVLGVGIPYWRKQLRWVLLGLPFVPLAFVAYSRWFEAGRAL